jgi:LysR family transcriptional regulator of gallate degradation
MSPTAPPSQDITEKLQNFRVFLSVADAKSIKGAADELFKAPSAITRSIMELERALDVPLFERKPRGMFITAYGEAVLARARRIHDELHAASSEILHSASPKGSLSSPSAVSNLLFSGRKLQLIVYLAELRNISSAAAHMKMTQSGVSMALARIESALGLFLFRRRIEGMMPTDIADLLVMHARRVFAELRHLRSDISAISGNLTGHVVIGSTPLGRTHFLPTAIATAISRQPELNISTVESLYEELVTGLRSGDIDIVFGVLRSGDANIGLVTEPLFHDRLSVLVRAGHRLTRRKHLSLSELRNEKWIVPRPNAPGRSLLDASFKAEGLKAPIPSVETGDLAIVRELLSASDLVAVTSPNQLEFEIRSGALVELPIELKGTKRDVGLIIREGAMLPPAALTLLEIIRSQVRERGAMH